ncbi:hypothetical protein GF406_07385 [candidate division KSB1 bacterium]|nr:hypothetical protein [candidate division KSB1 bacterium]
MKKIQLNFYLDMLYITFLCIGFLVFDNDFEFSNIGVIFFGFVLLIKHLLKIPITNKLPENKTPIERHYPWIFIILLVIATWMLGREKTNLLLDHPLVLILIWLVWFSSGLKTISQHEEDFIKKNRLNHKDQTK